MVAGFTGFSCFAMVVVPTPGLARIMEMAVGQTKWHIPRKALPCAMCFAGIDFYYLTVGK